jgi:hypothetical protein
MFYTSVGFGTNEKSKVKKGSELMFYMAIDNSAPRCREGDYSPRPHRALACYLNDGFVVVHFEVVYFFVD